MSLFGPVSECGPEGRRGLGHQPRRLDGTASCEIGGSGRGCGRVVAPGSPGRSRNVASQPAPKRPHCGRTPNSLPRLSGRSTPLGPSLHLQRELDDRGEQDQRQEHDEHQARPAPHCASPCGRARSGHRAASRVIRPDGLGRDRDRARGAQPELGRGRPPIERDRAHAVGVDEHHELRGLGVGERAHPAGPAAGLAPPPRSITVISSGSRRRAPAASSCSGAMLSWQFP